MIPATEVAAQLRKAVSGEVAVKLFDATRNWNEAFAGDVAFLIGEWKVTFFNDCDELDYTDSAEAPDGRTAEFDDWHTEESITCPLNLLSTEEYNELERLLAAA